MLNPKEFLQEVERLSALGVEGDAHPPTDKLMENLLIDLGYEEGVAVIRKQIRYYD